MLKGSFAYDALSPDASTLYLIQHVASWNFNRYVVRATTCGRTRSPGSHRRQEAARLGDGGVGAHADDERDGRWVYTLYQRPGGYPFIHALDTVNGTAHCIGAALDGRPDAAVERAAHAGRRRQDARDALEERADLANDEHRFLATHARAPAGLPWRWPLAGAGVALALALVVGAAAITRRHRTEAAPAPL